MDWVNFSSVQKLGCPANSARTETCAMLKQRFCGGNVSNHGMVDACHSICGRSSTFPFCVLLGNLVVEKLP